MVDASPPPKRRRHYSMERDVKIEVGGEIFECWSLTLMAASKVFERMLLSEMQEAETGHVTLPDKSADEFGLVLRHVEVIGGALPPKITATDVMTLLKWADEYQMDMLKQRCQQHLLEQPVDGVASLGVAVNFGLNERLDQCLGALSKEVLPHIGHLQPFLDNTAVMHRLWPAIFEQMRLPPPAKFPDSLVTAWPLIAEGVRASGKLKAHAFSCVDDVKVGSRVLCFRDANVLKRLCSRASLVHWTAEASQYVHWTESKGRACGRIGKVAGISSDRNILVLFEGIAKTWVVPFGALLHIPQEA